MISIGGSSIRARISRMIRPATSPIARPPRPVATNSGIAFQIENVPLTTAATAKR